MSEELTEQERELGELRRQWVYFTIHTADQPNVPCMQLGCPHAACWMLVEWYDKGRSISAVPFCDQHQAQGIQEV